MLGDEFTSVASSARDDTTRVAKLRVSGTVRVVSADFVEVGLRLRLNGDAPWLDLTHPDRPLLVVRRFSGKNKTREARELYIISAMRKVLTRQGVVVHELASSECREGSMGVTEWRYWAYLGGGLSVALEANADGTVALLGLD